MKRFLLAAFVLPLMLLATAPRAGAQDYPNRAIRIIVPFAAGGNFDLIPRIVAKRAAEILGQSIVIENRPGAAGRIAVQAAKRADPDGYTLFSSNVTTHGSNPAVLPDLGYDPISDFEPVAYFAEAPMGLMVSSKEPEKTLSEVVAVLRDQPGKWNYGSPGVGSQNHLVTVMFLSAMGVPQAAAVHVPFAGVNPAIQELVAGRIQFLFTSVGITLPFIASGAMRPIATTSATRRPQMPQVPTMIELGRPEVKIVTWTGLSAPTGTPAPILHRLNQVMNQALNDPQVQQQLSAMDYSAVPMTREQYGDTIKRDVALYKKVVAEGGLKFDK